MASENELKNSIVNTVRTLSMDAIQKANSGHPGAPMALAPVAFTVYDEFLKFNPCNPNWPNRDRFVLSAGHASMLLYGMLHVMGYDVSMEDIKNFRQLNSKTPGHPEIGSTPGVEMTTGPLGQGIGTSVGMAIAEKWLQQYFNRPGYEIVDYNVFAIASDGCMMEGISHESASLAGHLGLDNLVWFFDNNCITIEGRTDLACSEDVESRFNAYNWYVQHVDDANDLDALALSIKNAIKEQHKPSLIIVDSHIAFGAPTKQDTAASHGSPLGDDEIRAAKENYGWDPDKIFYVPEEVKQYTAQMIEKGEKTENDWNRKFSGYKKKYPELADQFNLIQNRELPPNWHEILPDFPADEKGIATRKSNGNILNAVAQKIPWLLGGSADLMPSTKTEISESEDFEQKNYSGRNFHFGIREHAMAAVVNGMVLSKLRAYGATFFVFTDYMRPAVRLAALMKQPAIYIYTHDSIGLGEDGPTHQPIEHLAILRATPHMDVIRPADANELSVLWKYIMDVKDHPVALVLTRQAIPTIDRNRYAAAEGALKGAYILKDSEKNPEIILIGTGSEVHICLDAAMQLEKEGVNTRVVSMPCWELFDQQSKNYRESVLPETVRVRISMEAGSKIGWEKYTGNSDTIVGMESFGASAPYQDLYKKFGLTIENIVTLAKKELKNN